MCMSECYATVVCVDGGGNVFICPPCDVLDLRRSAVIRKDHSG